MQVLKELFFEKRELLSKVSIDQLEQVVSLLDDIKDPRYIDFLMSICTCGGAPMAKIQGHITELLLIQNNHLLPEIRFVGETIHILLNEKHQTLEEWVDVSQFKRQIERAGKFRDLAGEIMNRPFTSLLPHEKKFRYFIRCTNLFGKLAMGRNQMALRALLFNPKLQLSYLNILRVMQMHSLPLLVRARYTSLMRHLFVDRDPNYQRPYILYTRAWSVRQASAPDEETWFPSPLPPPPPPPPSLCNKLESPAF